MDENLKEQIAQWHSDGRYDLTIAAVENIGATKLDMDISTLLRIACAYNNSDRLQDSINLLNSVRDIGKDHPVWNYYLGYALLFSEKKQEARPYLLRARELDSRVPAEDILYRCICYDGGSDMDDALLNKWVSEMLGGVFDGGEVSLSGLGANISANINQIKSDGFSVATLYFDIKLQSGETFFECCSGVGADPREAVCEALGSFYLGFYSGLKKMVLNQFFTEFTDNRSRTWKVFGSKIAGMGLHQGVSDSFYWELLKQAIPNYLGNKKIVYLKVYGAKNSGFVTAECRVNDYVSHSLGEILHGSVSEWNNDKFASHKQFFFMVCDSVEAPYRYSQEQINAHVKKAVELFSDQKTDYNEIFPVLNSILNDPNLASELHGFIPELCAERAFEKLISQDQISISAGDKTIECTKWQITSYQMIARALDQGLRDNDYPENAFRECVLASSAYGAILKAKESNADLEQGGSIRHYYNFHDEYVAG